ncbi:MAG: hypothetical protein WCI76_01920 [bacterium]
MGEPKPGERLTTPETSPAEFAKMNLHVAIASFEGKVKKVLATVMLPTTNLTKFLWMDDGSIYRFKYLASPSERCNFVGEKKYPDGRPANVISIPGEAENITKGQIVSAIRDISESAADKINDLLDEFDGWDNVCREKSQSDGLFNKKKDFQDMCTRVIAGLRQVEKEISDAKPANPKGEEGAQQSENPETPASLEKEETTEMLGRAFVGIYKNLNGMDIDDLEPAIKKVFPDASAERCYHRSMSHSEYVIVGAPDISATNYWMITIGNKKYLLPRQSSIDSFESTSVGYNNERTSPKDVSTIVPAELVQNQQRWEISRRGSLSNRKAETAPLKMENEAKEPGGDQKAEKIAKLRETIQNAQKRLEEIDRLLAEKKARKSEPANIENISIPERLGQAFVKIFKSKRGMDEEDVKSELEVTFPEAKVTSVYYPTRAQTVYFSNIRDGSASSFLRVTIGSVSYLLPKKMNTERFESSRGFDGYAAPNKIQKIVPAELIQNGQRWEIKKEGQLG